MQFKTLVIFMFSLLSVMIAMFYFSLNSSYQKSVNAKMYFYIGEYENAMIIAKEAYALNHYNKMAFSIMTQSEISMNYTNFIQEANEYYEYIKNTITSKNFIDKSEKYRIKMMTDIVIGKYKGLYHTRITDKKLLADAEKIYLEFKQINEKINEKL